MIEVIYREFRMLWGRKRFLFGMALLPIVSFVFLLGLFGDGELRNLPIAVVDQDQSQLSRHYVSMLDATAGLEVDFEPQSLLDAQRLIEKGDAYGVLIIPRGMQSDIYSLKKVYPQIFINSTRILNASLVYKDMAMVSQTLATGIELQMLEKQGYTASQAMQMALPIYYEKHVLFNPYTSYPYYLVGPFNLIMLLIFVALSSVYTLGMERREGTYQQWMALAGGSPFRALVGKLLPYTLYYFVILVLSNFYMYGVAQYPLEGSVVLLTLLSLFVIIAYQMLSLVIFVALKSMLSAMSVSAAVATMSFTMGGLTFPLLAMHRPIYYVAHMFPFTHYLKGYIDVMRGAQWWFSLDNLAILLVYIAVGILVTPKLFRLLGEREEMKLGIGGK